MSLSPFCDSRISLFEYNTLFNSVVEKFIQDCQPTGNQGNQGKSGDLFLVQKVREFTYFAEKSGKIEHSQGKKSLVVYIFHSSRVFFN